MKKYCGNCGHVINGRARMCDQCGKVLVENLNNDHKYSEKCIQIVQYRKSLTAPLVYAIIGLALFGGIGILFTFAARKRADKSFVPKCDNLTLAERGLYDRARRKHNSIKIMTTINMWIFLIQLVLFVLTVAFNVFVPCFVSFFTSFLNSIL